MHINDGYSAEDEQLNIQYGPFWSIAGRLPSGQTIYAETRCRNREAAMAWATKLELSNWIVQNMDAPEQDE